LGGDPAKALKLGAAIEIYHNWTLVHDDIIDRDDLRRGLPTTHKTLEKYAYDTLDMDDEDAEAYGKSFAILAGDIQQAWSMDLILRSVEDGVPAPLALALVRRLCETVNRELISGEALDVEFPHRLLELPSEIEVLKMMAWKTGTLLKFCVQAGGAIALGKPDFNGEPLARLGVFAERLGLAFQLIDDHLGVFGECAEFGKPICSDLREGKPTILYLKALAKLDEKGRAKLKSLTRLRDYGYEDVEAVRKLFRESGAEAANKALAAKFSAEAKTALSGLPDSKCKSLLSELAAQLLGRRV
jgi:geranylgeranyl diphosphate synthase type I